MDAKTLEATWN